MATFSVSENFGTYQGNTSYILDGNTSNCWRANDQQGSGKYVLVTASEPITVNTVTYSTTQSSEVFKSGANLQVSSDGTNYTDVGSFNGSTSQTFTVNKKCQYIRIYCTSGSSYVSISELAIDYTDTPAVIYAVNVQTGDGVTVDKEGSTTVSGGEAFDLTINGTISTITDNGADVKSQLVEHQPQSGGTVTSYPTAYSTSGSISGTKYQAAVGKGSSTTATGNDYAKSSGSTANITYSFDFSGIPENATITSVSVKVGGHLENTSKSTATLQLYSGSTAKGSQSKFTTTSKQVVTMTAGTWTRAELQSAKLTFTIGYYGGLVNGVDFVVEYDVPGSGQAYYTYSIASVTANHTIAINVGAVVGTRLRLKAGSYKRVLKIYRKVGGHYSEITEDDLDTTAKYVRKE